MIVKLKRKNRRSRLVWCWIWHTEANAAVCLMQFKKEANPSCMMLNIAPRGKLCHLLWCSVWLKEANTAILCEVEVDTDKDIVLLYHGVGYDSERQTLPSRVMCWIWNREASCVPLNTTERRIAMEESEEMMRGMPKCSKHEWRQKRGKMWAFVPYPAKYIQTKKWLIFYLDNNPHFFFLHEHCFSEVFKSVHD